MRVFARLSVCLAAVALLAPAAWGQGPGSGPTWMATKARGSWFGGKLCTECQRAKEMSRHGAHVPPPPPLPGARPGPNSCSSCGASLMVLSTPGPMTTLPSQAAEAAPYIPADGTGFASTAGDPVAIGAYSAPVAASPAPVPVPASPRSPASHDPSVSMSSYSPMPLIPPGANRPRVLSHLLGFSELGRDWRESRSRRREEAHASIRMGVPAPTVDSIPSRMVYGR